MSAWDALIRKSDLRQVELRASDAPDRALADGEVLPAVQPGPESRVRWPEGRLVIEGRTRPQDGHIIRPA